MKPSQAIQRLREVIRRQHKALSTEDSYVLWLRRYMGALPGMPKDLPSEKKLERFLTHMALREVSASTQNQAFNALVFFYKDVLHQQLADIDALRAKRPAHQRRAPSLTNTRWLLQTIKNVGGYWFQKRDKLGLKIHWPSGGPYLGFADQDLLTTVAAVLKRHRRCTL